MKWMERERERDWIMVNRDRQTEGLRKRVKRLKMKAIVAFIWILKHFLNKIRNQLTKKVTMVTPILPPEIAAGVGLPYLGMIPIRGGSELLLYGDHRNIWKYSVAKDSWEISGQILESRTGALVIETPKLYCP